MFSPSLPLSLYVPRSRSLYRPFSNSLHSVDPGAGAVNDSESLGAFPKILTAVNKRIYCNPKAQVRAVGNEEDDVILSVDYIESILHIPDFQSCLFQPGFLPFGKGKRLRCSGKFEKAILCVHEKQAEMFFYHCLKAFGFYEFRPWKYIIWKELQMHEREATVEEEGRYITLYRKVRSEKRIRELSKLMEALYELEYILTISSIMSMRRRAIGVSLSELVFSSPISQDVLLPYEVIGSDPQDDIMSRILAMKRSTFEETW